MNKTRESIPWSTQEFHDLAGALIDVLMFQACFTYFTGLRTNEVLRLRMDAQTVNDPGFVTYKNVHGNPVPEKIYFYESETDKQVDEGRTCHPALAQVIDVHRRWHKKHYPESPFYFPSPKIPQQPVDIKLLAHWMLKVSRAMKLKHSNGRPRGITPHGLRGGYATVRRSARKEDGTALVPLSDIVDELGHTSDRLVRNVYSKIREKLTFLPKDPERVAWARFLEPKKVKPAQPTLNQMRLRLELDPDQLPLI